MLQDQLEYETLSMLSCFPNLFDSVSDRLKPDLFTQPINNAMYRCMERRFLNGKGVDGLELAKELETVYEAVEVLDILKTHSHSFRGIDAKVNMLVDAHKQREIRSLGNDLAFHDGDSDACIDQAMAKLANIADQTQSQEWHDVYQGLVQHGELLEQRAEGKVKRLSTGLPDIDRMLNGGFERKNLVIIGARPSMGKTAMGLTMALKMAQTYPVAFFSLEMAHSELRDRMFACLGSLSLESLQNPKAHALDWTGVVETTEQSKDLRLTVNDKPNQTVARIKTECRRLKRKNQIEVVVIDYLGKIEPTDKKMPKTYQIEEITGGLKQMAKELDICVILLAQVNRGGAEKGSSPPGLVDLKDSGAIEQDGDVIGFIHRPVQLNPTLEGEWKNYAQFRIAKNRQGRTGDVHLFYHGEYTRFDSWAGEPPKASTASNGRGDIS
jgi:replicative DNA helicase